MEQLLASCQQAESFPRNLIDHDTYVHNLIAYAERLDKQKPSLFHKDENARLDLVDFDAQTRRSLSSLNVSQKELEDYMRQDAATSKSTLSRRFVFLTAPNSRDRLYISQKLLTYILSYHQVMPSFLDFLFLFGRQEHARDLNFSGFRQESRLEPFYNHLEIPELGRSGRELRMCYNLKSVEQSEHQPHFPWSIRQTAIYHSQDLETGKAFWIIVKGDELIKKRIQDSIGVSKRVNELDSKSNAFATSLATHMVICDWSSENWRWYISYLEETLRNMTGLSFAMMLDNPPNPNAGNFQKLGTSSRVSYPLSEKQWRSNRTSKLPPISPGLSLGGSSRPLPGPPPPPGPPPGINMLSSSQFPFPSLIQYSFTDLQATQLIGDRVNEVLLVLESNVSILKEIQEHYYMISESEHCPEELHDSRIHLEKFNKRINGIINDLHMQHSRGTTMLRQVKDRKDLLSEILKTQNLKASNALAHRARESQENMELITKDMHTLALKTKSETVSMRIITLVALFFLPGTFISHVLMTALWRYQTIMSTDIIRFQRGNDGKTQKLFELDALQLFLAICLPMMALVFVAWYGVYWWVNQEASERRQRRLDVSEQV